MTTTDNQNNPEDIRKYLITEAVDIKQLSQEKVVSDLEVLAKFEKRSNYKTDLSRNIKDEDQTRVMKALQLVNPFKGY
jgi:hypothetical protein